MTETVWESEDRQWRIVRHVDLHYSMGDLKGGMYDPSVNPDIDVEQLRREELAFERDVEMLGVWGLELERWNPEPGIGYENVDGVWGIVGDGEDIIEEFKEQVNRG